MRVRLKGVKPVRKKLADGSTRTYYYHRRSGRKIDGEPGTPEFMKSFSEAATYTPIAADTVAGLVREYKKSTAYTNRSPKTRKDYDRYLKMIVDEFGAVATEDLNARETRGNFLEWRDSMADTPRTADYALTVAARVLSWALDRGKLDVNRLARTEDLYSTDRSELIFTPDKLKAFEAESYPELTQALHLSIYTMQREGDCVRFGPGHVKGGRFRIRQQKTGAVALGPILDPVQAIIDGAHRSSRLPFLGSRNGQPWKLDHLRHEFRKVCVKAGIPEMHFHDARGTGITMAVAAGWDAGSIALMSGLTLTETSKVIERYFAREAMTGLWEQETNPYRKLERKPEVAKWT